MFVPVALVGFDGRVSVPRDRATVWRATPGAT
jgi:hypothetical protein